MSEKALAYLIGGPHDLTKRVLTYELKFPILRIAELPRSLELMVDCDMSSEEFSARLRVHVYERAGRLREDESGRDVYIYQYRGLDDDR